MRRLQHTDTDILQALAGYYHMPVTGGTGLPQVIIPESMAMGLGSIVPVPEGEQWKGARQLVLQPTINPAHALICLEMVFGLHGWYGILADIDRSPSPRYRIHCSCWWGTASALGTTFCEAVCRVIMFGHGRRLSRKHPVRFDVRATK
jgi:hypothetical protein